jgi:hypothetical protein
MFTATLILGFRLEMETDAPEDAHFWDNCQNEPIICRYAYRLGGGGESPEHTVDIITEFQTSSIGKYLHYALNFIQACGFMY